MWKQPLLYVRCDGLYRNWKLDMLCRQLIRIAIDRRESHLARVDQLHIDISTTCGVI